MIDCLKRKVVCHLYDENGVLLAVAKNQCQPKNNECPRIGKVSTKEDYPADTCSSHHAEIRALRQVPKGAKVHKSVIYGHDFYCPECERALKGAGVQVMKVERVMPEKIRGYTTVF